MVIHSHCAGKVSGIGKHTYMVILLQPRALDGDFAGSENTLCFCTTEIRDFRSATCSFHLNLLFAVACWPVRFLKDMLASRICVFPIKRHFPHKCKTFMSLTTTYCIRG